MKNGDLVEIDAEKREMNLVNVDAAEMEARKKAWKRPKSRVTTGTLRKYAKLVQHASLGCVTDE